MCGNNEDGDVQGDNSQLEDKHFICKVSTNLAAQKKGWHYLKSVEVLDIAILKALLATSSIT